MKVIYASQRGFHTIDLDDSKVTDVYLPKPVRERVVGVGVVLSVDLGFRLGVGWG